MPIPDDYRLLRGDPSQPAKIVVPIVPGPGVLPVITSALYVGGTGDVVVVDAYGNQATFTAVPAGAFLPIEVQRVLAATTATNIVGLA